MEFFAGVAFGVVVTLIWFGFNGCPFKYCPNKGLPNGDQGR